MAEASPHGWVHGVFPKQLATQGYTLIESKLNTAPPAIHSSAWCSVATDNHVS